MRSSLILVVIRACAALRASDSELMFNNDRLNLTVNEPFVTLTVPAYTGNCDTTTCEGVQWLAYIWGLKDIDKLGNVKWVDEGGAYEEGVQPGWRITKIAEKDFSPEAWKESWPRGQSADITFDCNGKPPPIKPLKCPAKMFGSEGKCLRNIETAVGWCQKKGSTMLPLAIAAVPLEEKTPFLEKEDWPVYKKVLESEGMQCNNVACYKWSGATCIRSDGLHMGLLTNMAITTSIQQYPRHLDPSKVHHDHVQVPFEDGRGTVEMTVCKYYHMDSTYYVPDPPAPCA